MNDNVFERIPVTTWRTYDDHVGRYEWAAKFCQPGDVVNDIACGIGYGASLLPEGIEYHGYDVFGAWADLFDGASRTFHPCDLNDRRWLPEDDADVTITFATLEHIERPVDVARTLSRTTRRTLLVCVPTRPTKHLNNAHLHDFTEEDVPPMFPGFTVVDFWDQPPPVMCGVWRMERE